MVCFHFERREEHYHRTLEIAHLFRVVYRLIVRSFRIRNLEIASRCLIRYCTNKLSQYEDPRSDIGILEVEGIYAEVLATKRTCRRPL